MLPFAAILAIASIGQTLVVQQRGLDLSVPGVISLSTIIVTRVAAGDDARLPLGIALAVGAGAVAGLVSGLAVTRFGITPVVATLAVNALLIGAIYQITGGAQSALASPALNDAGIGLTLGIPNTVIFAVLAVTVVSIVIRGTVVGRWFVAVGANPAAAQVAGIPVTRYRVATYVAASVCGALAGILLAGFLGSPGLNAGDGYLLPTIAAVVLGGTSLAGGSGSVVATAGGALFLTQLQLLVLSMGAPQPFQLIVQGTIIAVGMALRNVPWQRLSGRLWPAPAVPPTVMP
jgi:ribose transport system permease protein